MLVQFTFEQGDMGPLLSSSTGPSPESKSPEFCAALSDLNLKRIVQQVFLRTILLGTPPPHRAPKRAPDRVLVLPSPFPPGHGPFLLGR